jgi:hypothetical protein
MNRTYLMVLSREKDPAEIRFIRKVLLKDRGREGF